MTQHRRTPTLAAAIALALAGPAACDDPIDPVEVVRGARVLGARVEVAGDPGRASPRPGETATVRWFVVAPDGAPPSAGYVLGACASAGSRGADLPTCGGPVFATAQAAASTAVPELTFTVPSEEDVALAPRVLIAGSICFGAPTEAPAGDAGGDAAPPGAADGASSNEANGPCERASQTIAVAFELDLAGASSPWVNLNPTLGDGSISFDGTTWTGGSDVPNSSGCRGRLPEVPAGSSAHAVSIALGEHDRDPVPPGETGFDREDLAVSYFATAGALDRALSLIAPDEPIAPVSAGWTAPGAAPEEGSIVRFYFVVRDLRGGEDLATRALCVVP